MTAFANTIVGRAINKRNQEKNNRVDTKKKANKNKSDNTIIISYFEGTNKVFPDCWTYTVK